MYLYYGTTVENALKILESRQVKGKKGNRKHSNRYVRLSKNKLIARKDGEVVIRFDSELLENLIHVDYTKESFILKHAEIVDLVLGKRDAKNDVAGALKAQKDNKELFVKNKFNFNEQPVNIYLIHDNPEHMEEVKNELKILLIEGDKITKSPKAYEDFIASK